MLNKNILKKLTIPLRKHSDDIREFNDTILEGGNWLKFI